MMDITTLRACAKILRDAGLTWAAIYSFFGNWKKESLLDAFRVEPDLSEAALPSHEYVSQILTGQMQRLDFARDQRGFGLAQWTYFNKSTGQGRKLDLWDFWQRSGRSIDDPIMQTQFAVWELQNREWRAILPELQRSDNLYYLTDLVCKKYEKPTVNNVGDRYNAALEIKTLLEEQDHFGDTNEMVGGNAERYWPPRELCEGMEGPDVAFAQSGLWARGYTNTDTPAIFGGCTDKVVRRFQADRKLTVDGIIGWGETWPAILEVKVEPN